MKLSELLEAVELPEGPVMEWTLESVRRLARSIAALRHELEMLYRYPDANEKRITHIREQIKNLSSAAKISNGGGGKIKNPALLRNPYIGSPQDFPFGKSQRKLFENIQEALERNKIPKLSIMFAGYETHKEHYSQKTSQHLNFVVVGAGGNFVWYKYDVGGGSGQNYVYINGQKIKTSEFCGSQAWTKNENIVAVQDKLLLPLTSKKQPTDEEQFQKGVITPDKVLELRKKCKVVLQKYQVIGDGRLWDGGRELYISITKRGTKRQAGEVVTKAGKELASFLRKELPKSFSVKRRKPSKGATLGIKTVDVIFLDAQKNEIARVSASYNNIRAVVRFHIIKSKISANL